MDPSTPTERRIRDRSMQEHQSDIPIRAKLVFFTWLKKAFPDEILLSERKLFRWLNIARSSAYTILHRENDRQLTPQSKDPRGRNSLPNDEQIQGMIDLIEIGGWNAHVYQWTQLAQASGIDSPPAERTVQRALHARAYKKCETCRLLLLSPQQREERAQLCRWIQTWDETYLHRIRFSDEVHFGLTPTKNLVVVRRLGEMVCESCLHQDRKRAKAARECTVRYHCWAMIGYNYKSNLYFWNSADDMMTDRIYTQILERMKLPSREKDPSMILEENQDISHGTDPHSAVRTWKTQHGMEQGEQYYFNATGSPDLSIIESLWESLGHHEKQAETGGLVYRGRYS